MSRMKAPCCGAYVEKASDGRLVNWKGEEHVCPTRESVMGNGDGPEPREPCEFTIQRPAPIPTWEPEDGRGTYPWDQMEPCDMIFVRCPPGKRKVMSQRLSSAAGSWLRKHRPELTSVVRRVRGGVRLWMIRREEEAAD